MCKRSRSPEIDSESIPPGWELILGLLIRFTNAGSVHSSCTNWLRRRNSAPPPAFKLIYEGAIGQPR
jgi:hypothetical protein